jgi:hypothetical protein
MTDGRRRRAGVREICGGGGGGGGGVGVRADGIVMGVAVKAKASSGVCVL